MHGEINQMAESKAYALAYTSFRAKGPLDRQKVVCDEADNVACRVGAAQRKSLSLCQQKQKIDYEALNIDEEKLRYEHKAAQQKLSALSDKLAEHRGRMSATGDTAVLEQRKEELKSALQQAKLDVAKIDLALEALHTADDRIRSRFSPRITAEAGKILSQLTGGKYPAVQLSPEMQLSVRDGVLQRPAAAMSCGTGDQMYLALRLAMCRMLLPKDAPLLLDDALVNFDNTRCEAAVELLTQESEKRQVILFTCRTLQ